MLDTTEMTKVMEKLEGLEDEALAVKLLGEFNEKTSRLGLLIRNLDPSLEHSQWKSECDQAAKEVNEIVAKILSL